MGAVAFTQLPASGRGGERMAWLLDFSEFDSAELRSIRGVRDEYERLGEVLIGGGYAAADVVCEPTLESAASEGPDSLLSFPGHASLSRRMTVSAERPALLLVVIVGTAVAADGRTMLCLRDSNPEDSETMLSLEQLQQILSGDWNLAEQTIVVLDVGRNPWFRGGPVNLLRDLQRLKAESASLRDRSKTAGNIFWISTCSSGERSIVSEGTGRGVYLDALTTALAGAADGQSESPDGLVSLREAVVFADERVRLSAAAIWGCPQHSWYEGAGKSDLTLARANWQSVVVARQGEPGTPGELGMLSGPRLESARVVGECRESLRAGKLADLFSGAAEATRLDPGNLQCRRLQLLAHLCARQFTQALTLMSESSDEIWIPAGDQAVAVEAGNRVVDTAVAGDFVRAGVLSNAQSEHESVVEIVSIRDGKTGVSRVVAGQVSMTVLRQRMQQIEAVDWVQEMADELQLSPRVVQGFVVVYVAAVEKNQRQRARQDFLIQVEALNFRGSPLGLLEHRDGSESVALVETVNPGQLEKNRERFRRILLAR